VFVRASATASLEKFTLVLAVVTRGKRPEPNLSLTVNTQYFRNRAPTGPIGDDVTQLHHQLKVRTRVPFTSPRVGRPGKAPDLAASRHGESWGWITCLPTTGRGDERGVTTPSRACCSRSRRGRTTTRCGACSRRRSSTSPSRHTRRSGRRRSVRGSDETRAGAKGGQECRRESSTDPDSS
jgi:hypothetical protein